MGWAATGGVHGRILAKRDRARLAGRTAIRKFIRIHALELTLEEPIELLVSRLLLAVRYAEGVGLAIYETNNGRVSSRRIICHKLGRHDVRSCVAAGQRFE